MQRTPTTKESFNLATGLPAEQLVWLKGAGQIFKTFAFPSLGKALTWKSRVQYVNGLKVVLGYCYIFNACGNTVFFNCPHIFDVPTIG
jgi:hypothetical protein